MSIASARDEIRRRRRLVELSTGRWRMLSTAGTYHHELRWDQEWRDVVCDTCADRYGVNRCWARGRCLEHLRALNAEPQLQTEGVA